MTVEEAVAIVRKGIDDLEAQLAAERAKVTKLRAALEAGGHMACGSAAHNHACPGCRALAETEPTP